MQSENAEGPASRSDGCVLHADFEKYEDGLIGVFNAGVRWLGDPFATNVKQNVVTITSDPATAFGGRRAAYVFTNQTDQRGRIVLQSRWDAPAIRDEVIEFVFRPVMVGSAELREFVIWSAYSAVGEPVGIVLRANSGASEGVYSIDIEDGSGKLTKSVVSQMDQTQWVRIVMHRDSGEGFVKIWIGSPDDERLVGSFVDAEPESCFARAEIGDLDDSHGFGSGYWDDVRVGRELTTQIALAPAETVPDLGPELTNGGAVIAVSGEKQLFVDDSVIQSQTGLHRIFHSVSKCADNPLLAPQTPLEVECKSLLPMTILRDVETGSFRCWYAIWGKAVGKPTFEALAESTNGLQWTRPNLGLLSYAGSSANNLLREGRMFRVLHDPEDPDPNRRYKAIIRDAGFLAGFSADGLKWKTTVPVLDQAYDATSVHWDPRDRKWIASCKIWKDNRRTRGYAESRDFLKWTDTAYMFSVDDRDGAQDQVYSMSIIPYQSIYIGLIKMYHLETDRCDIQIAFSRDAKHWNRPFRQPFIANGASKSDWDYGNLDPVDQIHLVNGELWFLYSGRSTLHNQLPNDGAMGLAKLRVDGFASMDAGDEEGVLITRPLILKGRKLSVNADVATGGKITVEILDGRTFDTTTDEADVPVYPFTRDNAVPIISDGINHAVRWENAASLQVLRGRQVRLRFRLHRARLYSFWSE
jgi:regulation of enolase protein 1 (concanavalin A-like superfamily)